MTLPVSRGDREYKKFVEDISGDVAIRVVAEDALPVSGGGSGGGSNTYSNASNDFTATANSGAKTITITGLSYTLEDKHVIPGSIKQVTSAGAVSTVPLTNVSVSSGVITLADMSANFAVGDTVVVTILGPDKAYSQSTDNNNVAESDPLDTHYVNDDLVDTTNVSAATHYYPGSTGGSLATYKDLSISGKLIDADGTLTLTVEMMNDEDTSSGDWIQVYGYDDKNNTTTNSWTVTNGTLTFANSFNNAGSYSHYRVAVVASGATNTVIVKGKKKAL